MADMCFGSFSDYVAHDLTVCWVLGTSQHRAQQDGWPHMRTKIFQRVSCHDFQGENPRSGINWLYT
jgi:hypothetical protein